MQKSIKILNLPLFISFQENLSNYIQEKTKPKRKVRGNNMEIIFWNHKIMTHFIRNTLLINNEK